ncbi:D-arabinono-1,4-lactone oxidase-domain-containing protein [Lipomyces japonicus]|uniref:D-arabinono-1,4-lactone oxidase-domain-containing protein n=1 Tax=Lipomyces japonicus TaxID=56871 RepID=UPI0034CEF1C6
MTSIEQLLSFKIPGKKHWTWARTFICQPELYLVPNSIEQLQLTVRTAHKNGKTITVVGSGHSPSDITMSNQWVVNLDKLNRALSFAPHDSGLYTDVRVEAGIRIYQLNNILASRGLALQNLGSISEQSIAGLISTGTHGSSAYHGLISQQVVDVTLLLANGELVTVSQSQQPELFRAALISLGKLGVITHVTIRTIPSFTIHSRQEIVDFDNLIRDWNNIWISSEYIRVWWFPYSRKCILWRANKSHKQLSAPRPSFYGTWIGRLLYESLLWFAVRIYPKFMPSVERWVFRNQYGWDEDYGSGGSEAVQGSVEGLNMDCLFHQFVNEWALPLSDGVDILKNIENAVLRAGRENRYYVHAPIEVRCSNCSYPSSEKSTFDLIEKTSGVGPIPGNTLKPLLDYAPIRPYPEEQVTTKNLVLYLNATMYRPFGRDPPVKEWYQEFEDIMVQYGGRPHWAKNFIGPSKNGELDSSTQNSGMIGLSSVFDDWFSEDGKKFKEIRRKIDPDGIFLGGKEWAARNGIIDS